MPSGGRPTGPRRRDRMIRERRHDPYRAKRKLSEPTVCPGCGAVFREGRWRWAAGPADAPRSLCPACQRARDSYPAGVVRIEGSFWTAHREEIERLCRNTEAREKARHALNRILELEEVDGGLLVTTTDVHLARTIGDALHAAYAGQLETTYDEGLVRVAWSR